MSDEPAVLGVVTLALTTEQLDEIAQRVAALSEERQALEAQPYLTVVEVAELLRAKPQRVYDLLSARRLTRFKDGSRTLVARAEVEQYLANGGRR